MHTLRKQDRDNSMEALVSFHQVPMPRMVAFAINHIEDHGGKVAIFSADRTVAAVLEHNHQFHTNLHSQQYAIDHQGEPGWSTANPLNRTSHCYFADATIAALLTHNGHPTKVGDKIPRWAVGIDLADVRNGVVHRENVSTFLAVAKHLHYDFRQPYPNAGTEKHHVILVNSPIPQLEAWNVISKDRHTRD
jgi:hypothetical protein